LYQTYKYLESVVIDLHPDNLVSEPPILALRSRSAQDIMVELDLKEQIAALVTAIHEKSTKLDDRGG
jgi:hypothetical protein